MTYSDAQGVDTASLGIVIGGVDRTGLFAVGPASATGTLTGVDALPEGETTIVAQIADLTANLAEVTSTVRVDTLAPTKPVRVSPPT